MNLTNLCVTAVKQNTACHRQCIPNRVNVFGTDVTLPAILRSAERGSSEFSLNTLGKTSIKIFVFPEELSFSFTVPVCTAERTFILVCCTVGISL